MNSLFSLKHSRYYTNDRHDEVVISLPDYPSILNRLKKRVDKWVRMLTDENTPIQFVISLEVERENGKYTGSLCLDKDTAISLKNCINDYLEVCEIRESF